MDSVLYSWLAAAAVAPFVVMLSCWTLAVFRSYRSDWRLLDIFLYALTCLEVSSSLFGFGYAILGAIRPDLEAPCLFLVWGLTATRVFHLSTVTSLLLDRALACKWPQKYLSSVRHSQVRYHIIVLGVISVFVGVTSVFARLPPAATSPRHCSLHPLDWDVKFSAFLACVYGMLLITGFGCCLVVQAGRFRSRTSYRTTSFSRDSATSRSTASCEESRDLEWAVAASVCWLAYMVNHGPYLVLCSLGMWAPSLWSEWLDNSVVWLGLAQGLLVPGVLLLADMPHRSALSNMLKQSGRVYRHLSDHGGLRMRIGETTKPSYPLYAPFPAPFPQRLRWSAANLPSLQSLQPLDAETLRKGYGSAGYTTLLSLPSSATTFSSPWSSCSSMGQSVNSVTTNAVNDFVFRRPSVLALFEPQQTKRCDTPTPFAEESGDYESICNCDAAMNSRPSSRNARCNCNAMLNGNPGSRDSFCNCNNFGHRSLESSRNDTCNCNNLNDRTVPSRDCICKYNHFGNSTSSSKGNNGNCKNLGNNSLSTIDVICNCNQLVDKKLPWRNDIFNSTRLADKKPLSRQASCSCKFNPIGSPKFTLENNENRKPQETINKNMINIILAYENPNTSFLGRVDSPENIDQIEENCFEDRSSTSSESSDADSVQSVIIRQRVDQKGRVSSSDISRVEKKLFKCDKDTETKANTDNVVSEQRVLYSEYL